MSYEARNFNHLLGLEGFSDELLKNHFALYQGYVQNTNKLLDMMKQLLDEGKELSIEFSELRRRFGWEFNGMRLHEYFFGNLCKSSPDFSSETEFAKKINQDFASFELWKKDFLATANMRGIGWTVLYFDSVSNKLMNVWINEHDAGHLAGLHVILILDVFEHAYMLDYGIKRKEYLNAFFDSIDWAEVNHRFNLAAYQEVSV